MIRRGATSTPWLIVEAELQVSLTAQDVVDVFEDAVVLEGASTS